MGRPEAKPFPVDLAVFGGSFDPVHNGHLMMAKYVLDEGYAHRLAFMPAAVSPFKEATPPVPFEDRCEMLRIAISEIDRSYRERIDVFDLEIRRPPPSYTVDSMREIRESHPGLKIGILLGSDSVPHLDRWKAFEDILRHHTIMVFMRVGNGRESILHQANRFIEMCGSDGLIEVLKNREVDCSSTDLRGLLESRSDADYLIRCVPESVMDYIDRKKLYVSADL
jgi:nicotinate-nucleotide adenylyltransferase